MSAAAQEPDCPAQSPAQSPAQPPAPPTVDLPDPSRARAPAARAALAALIEVLGVETRWRAGHGEAADLARRAILDHYAREARAPSLARLSALTHMAPHRLRDALRRLRERDLVVFGRGAAIVGAYPFTDRETGHRVRLGRTWLNAMCAIDALGAGAMFGRDSVIESGCGTCGAPIRVETRDHGVALKAHEPDSAVVWCATAYARNCAATSLCAATAFFCSDAHLASLRRSEEAGHRLSVDEAHQVGTALFAPMPVTGATEKTRSEGHAP